MVDAHPKRGKQRPFAKADTEVWRDETLPLQVKAVYTYLATFCGNAREAFPSRARIAREVGISVRTVDTANKIAKACGLFTITRKAPEPGQPDYAEFHQPNIYLLHDFDGGYEVGSGPLAQPLRQEAAQSDPGAGAATAHYQDQSSPPSTAQRQTNTPTGGDDVASSGRKHVSDAIRFHKPKGYDRLDSTAIAGRLPGVFVKIMKKHGLDPHERGVNEIGNWVHWAFGAGWTRQQVWAEFQVIVRQAVAGEKNEWLIQNSAA